MILNIVGISRKLKTTQYGEKISVGLKTKEYGEKWLNGWQDEVNVNWVKDGIVEATVEQKGEWLNFKAIKPSVAPQAVYQASQPIYQPQPPKNTSYTPNLAPQAIIQPAKDVNWDKISRGKCKFGFLIEAYKLGKALQEAEMESELWADASMRNLADSPLTPGQEGEINIGDEPPF